MKKSNYIDGKCVRGFTLIELMVTIAIAAILAAMAVPSFNAFFNRNRIAGATNDYLNAINYARSEAIKGGATTTLCVSSDGATCTGGTNWTNGWIVWSDRNGNAALDAGELLRAHAALTGGNVVIGGGAQSSFSFVGQGVLQTGSAGDTFNICTPNDLTLSNQVTVELSGHLRRVAAPTLASCP